MSFLNNFFIQDWGIPISIVIGIVLLIFVPMIILSHDYAMRLEVAEQKVIEMSCQELKQYVIDDLLDKDSERRFVQKAKELYEWKCEK